MPKDLLIFLFNESFQPSSEEALDTVFERLSEIEDLEVKTGPLQKVLKGLGYDGDVCVNPDGTAQICCDASELYASLVGAIQSPDGLLQLAELGWVPDFKGDDQGALDNPHFVIGFISIATPTPSDGDKIADLEKLLKGLDDEDGPEGIGADLKISKDGAADKGAKVPQVKSPKPQIRDSVEDGEKTIFLVKNGTVIDGPFRNAADAYEHRSDYEDKNDIMVATKVDGKWIPVNRDGEISPNYK